MIHKHDEWCHGWGRTRVDNHAGTLGMHTGVQLVGHRMQSM